MPFKMFNSVLDRPLLKEAGTGKFRVEKEVGAGDRKGKGAMACDIFCIPL